MPIIRPSMYVDYQHNDLSSQNGGHQESLQEAFDFDAADLNMNRTGKLSTPQMTRLVMRSLGPFIGLVASACGLLGLSLFLWLGHGAGVGVNFKLTRLFGNWMVLGMGGLFFGIIALVMKALLASGRLGLLVLDLIKGDSTIVSGRLTPSHGEEIEDGLNTVTGQKTSNWNCVVKGEYFEIPEEGFTLLQDRSGENYKLHITPRSRFLVAIEPTGVDPNARDPFKMEYKSN